MFKLTNKKGVLERKLVSSFLLVAVISSQFYATTTYAMPTADIPQSIWNVTKDIVNAITKVGEGVLKAGVATTLNNFAQQLAVNTVQGAATGQWGDQPLYFNLPLEDMLQQTMDQVTGDYLDKLSATLKYDVCKPLNADLDWKFKIALNIIPEQRDNNLNLTPPACTLSKFVDAVNQSFANITESIRKTFAADCFDEFQPNYANTGNPFDASANSVMSLGALTNFTYEGVKDFYLYNVPGLNSTKASASYFTKKDIFYMQGQVRPECSEIITGCFIKDSNIYVGQPVNDVCVDLTFKSSVEKRDVSFCRKSEFVNADSINACGRNLNLNNISGDTANLNFDSIDTVKDDLTSQDAMNALIAGACVSKNAPYKKNDVYVADTVKQRKFLNQYKGCYLTKINQAFQGFLEVGQLPKQKIQDQKVKLGCQDIVDSLITPGHIKNAAQFYAAYDLYFQKNLWSKNKILGKQEPELYKTVLRAALLSSRGVASDGTQLNANGDSFSGYLKSQISFFDPFEQSIVNCSEVSDGSSSNPKIDVSNCFNQEGENGIVSSNDNSVFDTSLIVNSFESNFAKLMIKAGDPDDSTSMFVDDMQNPKKLCFRSITGSFINCVGLRKGNDFTKDYLENSSKISQIREDLIDVCVKNAVRQVSALSFAQSEKNKAFIEQEKQKQLIEIKEKQSVLESNFAKSDFKPVSEPISHEVKSTPGMVTFNLEQALGSSANLLQPTGDLFIDPVKIFVTTLLSEGSKKLMEGLFSRSFPMDGVDEDLSALNGIGDLDAESVQSNEEENNCSVPGPLANGSICIVDRKFNNGICKSCYCESRVGFADSNNVSTYGTCQSAPISR